MATTDDRAPSLPLHHLPPQPRSALDAPWAGGLGAASERGTPGHHAGLICLLVAALAVVLIAYGGELSSAMGPALLPTILCAAICLAGVLLSGGRNPDLLRPPAGMGALFGLLFVVMPVVHATADRWKFPHLAPKLDHLAEAQWLVTLAIAAFLIGYFAVGLWARSPVPRPARPVHPTTEVTGRVLALFALASLLSYLALVGLNGGFGVAIFERTIRGKNIVTGTGWFFWGALLGFGPAVWLRLRSAERDAPLVRTLVTYTPVAVVMLAFTVLGGRGRALMTLLAALVAGHYVIKPMRMRGVVALLVFSLIFGFFVGRFRDTRVKAALVDGEAERLVEIDDLGQAVVDTLVAHVSRVEDVMLAVEAYPSYVPYMGGSTFLQALFGPLGPRFGIEGASTGGELVRFALSSSDVGWGDLPSLPGDLHMNFGPLGVPIGFLVLGIFLRVLYDWYRRQPTGDLLAAAIYAFAYVYWLRVTFETIARAWELLVVLAPLVIARAVRDRAGQRVAAPKLRLHVPSAASRRSPKPAQSGRPCARQKVASLR